MLREKRQEGLLCPLSRSKDLDCLDVLSDNLFSAHLANSSASCCCPLLLSPFNNTSQLYEGVIRLSQAEKWSDETRVFVYMCERQRDLRIISAVKTSAGQEMALARAADRRERDALARPGPCSAFQPFWPIVLC